MRKQIKIGLGTKNVVLNNGTVATKECVGNPWFVIKHTHDTRANAVVHVYRKHDNLIISNKKLRAFLFQIQKTVK